MGLKIFKPKPGKRELVTVALLVLEIIFFGLTSDNFFTAVNIRTVIENAAEIGIIAIGMNLCISLGGIDLTVGSSLGVCAIIAGKMLQAGADPVLILLVSLAVGICVGFVNGFIITTFDIPPIIATLALSNVLRALIFGLLGGKWLTGLPPVFTSMTKESFLGIPGLLIVLLLFYVCFYFIMMNMPFGRHVYAVGSNHEAAGNVGINIKRTKMLSFVISGGIVGFAAMLYISRMGAVDMTVGSSLPIQCIAAVFIGGTSVGAKSGRGSLLGTLAGVFFIAFMKNGIVLLGVPSLLENAMIGSIIILSVLLDYFGGKIKGLLDFRKKLAPVQEISK